jgi:hypothetical protein
MSRNMSYQSLVVQFLRHHTLNADYVLELISGTSSDEGIANYKSSLAK